MIYLSFYGKMIKIQYSLLWLINDKPYFKGDVLKLKTIKQKYAVFRPTITGAVPALIWAQKILW